MTAGSSPEAAAAGAQPLTARETVIQLRVQEAERHLRKRRLFALTIGSAALGAAIGIGSLMPTIHNGTQQTEPLLEDFGV